MILDVLEREVHIEGVLCVWTALYVCLNKLIDKAKNEHCVIDPLTYLPWGNKLSRKLYPCLALWFVFFSSKYQVINLNAMCAPAQNAHKSHLALGGLTLVPVIRAKGQNAVRG